MIFGGNGEDSLNLELSERGISRYEVGSPNIAAIGTLKTAIDTIEKDLSGTQERENRLLKYLIKKLEDIDGIHIFQKLETEEEFQNHIAVLSIGFEKYMSDDAGTILDGEYDIAVSLSPECYYELQFEINNINVMMLDSSEIEVKANITLCAIAFSNFEENYIFDVNVEPLDFERLHKLPGISPTY